MNFEIEGFCHSVIGELINRDSDLHYYGVAYRFSILDFTCVALFYNRYEGTFPDPVNAAKYIKESFPEMTMLAEGIKSCHGIVPFITDKVYDFILKNTGTVQSYICEDCSSEVMYRIPWILSGYVSMNHDLGMEPQWLNHCFEYRVRSIPFNYPLKDTISWIMKSMVEREFKIAKTFKRKRVENCHDC